MKHTVIGAFTCCLPSVCCNADVLITIRALVMGDGVPCYGALEIVGLLILLLLLLSRASITDM